MDKGIRNGVKIQFNAMLPQLTALGGKAFRKAVRTWTIENYGCTESAASTHYAHAFNEAKKAIPEQLAGLGRAPEKNNGGRKKAVVLTPEQIEAAIAAAEAAVAECAEALAREAGETGEAQTAYNVCKKANGSVVAEGLSLEDARELVSAAARAKKAKLYFV